jgi:hypothetical protein
LALLLVMTAISLGYEWVEQFYRGVAVNGILSFPSFDAPWMPVHTAQVAIIGNHYFGDFQLPYGWGLNVRENISPYLGSAIPANYPPLAILFYVPFTFLPVKFATGLFLVLTSVVFILPLWILLSPLRSTYRCIMLVPIVLMAAPFISTLDRANNIGIGIGLAAWSLVAWRNERWLWCGILLAAAIAFKVYPVALLVVPLALRRYRFAVLVAVAVVSSNLLALACIPGGFVQNLRAVIPAMTSQRLTTGESQLTSLSLYSLVPKVAGLLFGPGYTAQYLEPDRFLLWLPSVLYLVFVFIIIQRHRVPQWCWGPLGLASIQLVVPQSGAYTAGWACLGAIWFASGSLIRDGLKDGDEISVYQDDKPLRISLMLALTASLVPSIFSILGAGGFSTSATRFLSPALLFVTLCLAMAKSFSPPPVVIPHEVRSLPVS